MNSGGLQCLKLTPQISHFVTHPSNPHPFAHSRHPHLPTPASQLKPLPHSSYNFTPPRPYPKTLKPKPSSPHTHYYATHLPTFYTPAFTPRTHAPALTPPTLSLTLTTETTPHTHPPTLKPIHLIPHYPSQTPQNNLTLRPRP